MAIHNTLILAFWLVFLIYWGVMALSAKRTLGKRGWRHAVSLRLGLFVLALLALRLPGARQALRHASSHAISTGVVTGAIGIALCALGIGLAIWARACLGRNWGTPMSRKEDPDLVTGGPYAVIRHPIYTGLLLAMIGSVLGKNPFWVLLLPTAAYLIYSARREETLMAELFPDRYPAYRRRTKMLVPFLF